MFLGLPRRLLPVGYLFLAIFAIRSSVIDQCTHSISRYSSKYFHFYGLIIFEYFLGFCLITHI